MKTITATIFLFQVFISTFGITLDDLPHGKLENALVHLQELKSKYSEEANELHSNFTVMKSLYISNLVELKLNYEEKIKEKLRSIGLDLSNNCTQECVKLPNTTLNKTNQYDCRNQEPRKDCLEFYQQGYHNDGFYKIRTSLHNTADVYCDQTTAGGGWTVFQRHHNGSAKFDKNWNEYKNGFGSVDDEFWLGNENIHQMTSQLSSLMLSLKLEGSESVTNVQYQSFSVGDEKSGYQLAVSGYFGSLVNKLNYNNGMRFSAYDRDNDRWSRNCAAFRKAGWWYDACTYVNLNIPSMVYTGSSKKPVFSEMKFRRKI